MPGNRVSDLLKDKTFDAALDRKACRGVVAEGKPAGKDVHLLTVFAKWFFACKKGEATVTYVSMQIKLQFMSSSTAIFLFTTAFLR